VTRVQVVVGRVEVGWDPVGIRVVGLRPHGMPDTSTMKEAFDAKASGMTWEQFQEKVKVTGR
jgi:hypothetical protein